MAASSWLTNWLNTRPTRTLWWGMPPASASSASPSTTSTAATPLPSNWKHMTTEQKKTWVLANRMGSTSGGTSAARTLMAYLK
jgi:hypothetical protein